MHALRGHRRVPKPPSCSNLTWEGHAGRELVRPEHRVSVEHQGRLQVMHAAWQGKQGLALQVCRTCAHVLRGHAANRWCASTAQGEGGYWRSTWAPLQPCRVPSVRSSLPSQTTKPRRQEPETRLVGGWCTPHLAVPCWACKHRGALSAGAGQRCSRQHRQGEWRRGCQDLPALGPTSLPMQGTPQACAA